MEVVPAMRLIKLLETAESDSLQRMNALSEFEHLVHTGSPVASEAWMWDEVFADLAYDIAFYEPRSEIRATDSALVDDESIGKDISTALSIIRSRVNQ